MIKEGEGALSTEAMVNIILLGSWSIKEINNTDINNRFFYKLTHLTNTLQHKSFSCTVKNVRLREIM